jgi:hypothetical protein
MTDLSHDAYLKILGEAHCELWALDTSAAQTLYNGQPMIIDQSEDTVNLRGFVTATVVATTDVFIGIARLGEDGFAVPSGGVEANYRIQVYTWPTIIGFKSSVWTNADLGRTVYMSDSATLSATASQNPQIGKLHRVEDGYCWVQLVTPQICSGA